MSLSTSTNSVGSRRSDESAEALDQFISTIRSFPVLEHAEAMKRFRALAVADAEFRSALMDLPETAEQLVAYWRERKSSGHVTGLMIEAGGRTAGQRSKAADDLLAMIADLTASAHASRSIGSAGVATQIRELLEQTRIDLPVLHGIHDALVGSKVVEAGRVLSAACALDSLRRASSARERWESMRSDLVRHNLKLVVSVAKRFRRSEISLLELIQEGAIGLVRAVEKFDPERGFRFSTYAVWWIEQAVIRGIQKSTRTIRLPTHVHEQQIQYRRADRGLRSLVPCTPSVEQLADRLKLSLEDTEALASTLAPIKSIQAPLGGDEEGQTLEDVLENVESESPGKAIWRNEIRDIIGQSLDALTPRERSVLGWRYGFEDNRPESLETIGKRLGLSRERIRQIETGLLKKLRECDDIQALADALPGNA